jgi:hypothetical protein
MSAALESEGDGTMSGREPFPADLLTYEEYLLDPPATVWEGLLRPIMPHGWESRAWMWYARRGARALGRDLTREAWLVSTHPPASFAVRFPGGWLRRIRSSSG